MALMVIFIHQDPEFLNCENNKSGLLFNIIASAGSQVLPRVAVPLFFLISGYLYFYKLKEWNTFQYVKKTKKRFRSLVLPYFYWNCIAYLVMLAWNFKEVIFRGKSWNKFFDYLQTFNYHIFLDSSKWDGGWHCFGLFKSIAMTGPIDYPLWFVRNLIVLTLLTPMFHFLIRRIGKTFILVLGLAYISNLIAYPLLGMSDVFYFCLGCYMSINNITIFSCFNRIKRLAYFSASFFSCLCVYFDVIGNTRVRGVLMPIYVFFGVICVYCFVYNLVSSHKNIKQFPVLVSSSFFVFSIHTIFINTYAKSSIHVLINYIFRFCPILVSIIGYIMPPFIVAATCVLIYVCMKKLVPFVLSALTGNR